MPKRTGWGWVELFAGDGDAVASWPIEGAGRPDLAVVEALARLQMKARRSGFTLRLREPSAELARLLDLVGLADVVGGASPSGIEAGGKAEGGEEVEVHEIEEVVVPDDPVA
ncbi:MAG: STAS domain-containing protein [Acidimicrobiia bacterium]